MTKQEIANQGTKTATYTNTFTKETYTLGGVRDLAHAWSLMLFVCETQGWNNIDGFVTVK